MTVNEGADNAYKAWYSSQDGNVLGTAVILRHQRAIFITSMERLQLCTCAEERNGAFYENPKIKSPLKTKNVKLSQHKPRRHSDEVEVQLH